MLAPESFSLPKEFEGFVSNADSLLQQFQRLDIEDAVTITIYPDQILGSGTKASRQSDLLNLLEKLTATVDEISQAYIWFKESLKLVLIVPDDKNEPAHYCGIVKFSDSIEDEWFITYIAFKLTELFPNISVSVIDADGQFLLIESADFIPDWIDPENCDNRLWIRNGKVHIVSLDEAGRNIHDCGIKLTAALEAVQNRPKDTIASSQVQTAIAQRTTAVYPSKTAADAHLAYCTVSSTVSKLLEQCPELVSIAVNSFCLPAAAGSNKNYIAAMQKFGPDLTDLKTVPIKFTRLQYAKIMYQNFHTPKKFHSAMRIVSGAENRKLTESFDIGCRLICGLESAYQRKKSENASNKTVNSKLMKETELKRNLKSKIFYSSIHIDDTDVQSLIDNLLSKQKSTKNTEANQDENKDSNNNENLSEFQQSKMLLNDYNLNKKLVPEDSSSWMFLSPEELDKEMEARVNKFKNNTSENITPKNIVTESREKNYISESFKPTEIFRSDQKHQKARKDGNDRNNEEDSEAAQLQKMLEGMKTFLGSKSGIDGVDVPSASIIKSQAKSVMTVNVENMAVAEPTGVAIQESVIMEINEVHHNDVNNIEVANISNINNNAGINNNNNNNNNNNDNDNKVNNDCNDESGLEIDFEKLISLLQNETPETKTKTENLKKEEPLSSYFYENDLNEFSSDESDYDSDDEIEENENDERIEDYDESNDTNAVKNVHSSNLIVSKAPNDRTGHSEFIDERKRNEDAVISMIGIKKIQISNKISNKSRNKNRNENEIINNDDAILSEIKMLKLSDANNLDHGNKIDSDDEIVPVKMSCNVRPVQVSTDSQHGVAECKPQGDGGDLRGLFSGGDDEIESDEDSFYDESEPDSDDEIAEEEGDRTHGRRSGNADFASNLEERENSTEYFEEYEQTMDLELASSTLVESFERYAQPEQQARGAENQNDSNPEKMDKKAPEDVNVDLNFLKYLLESHASQLGSAGPATQLFSQLGIQLPHLPPMNVKPENDA